MLGRLYGMLNDGLSVPFRRVPSNGKNHLYYSNSNLGKEKEGAVLAQPFEAQTSSGGLADRAGETLRLMHRWGYAPRIEVLSEQLLGGPTTAEHLNRELEARPDLVVQDGFVSLKGYADLIRKSRRRIDSHQGLQAGALTIARDFARDLASSCPMVDCIALSGSLASGGYGPQDDIDFDLFVQPGTKYICYLLAHLVGLRFSWRYRHLRLDEVHRTPLFPKITCVNVVWPEDQAKPFVRRDENMAFELLRCEPLYGAQAFKSALESNLWVRDYFPQAYGREWPTQAKAPPNITGRILEGVRRSPKMLRWLDGTSRKIAWMLYRYVQRSRRSSPRAVARMEFLRQVKFPYEVFQD